ncbi:MAG: DUF2911 domain-containing protein [Bacteroidota bacterium]
MQKFYFLFVFLFLSSYNVFAQFHTLKMPQSSNEVYEQQTIGVTDIKVHYHSPAVRGRNVWNNQNVIPQNGSPIPWRAGANMNTTISFSTDVKINGQDLPKGKYGFHIIPNGNNHTLLFAHNNNLWGSYYLDVDQDVSLKVEVQDTVCTFSEKLDFEFLPHDRDKIVVALEWADKRIPFTVSVDLKNTVVTSLRSELRGENTYRWQAWNDAANWCYNNDTNLEEALEWATRSIEGGYNGFGADKNMQNITTKTKLLKKLNREEESEKLWAEVLEMNYEAQESNSFMVYLLRDKEYKKAVMFGENTIEKFPNVWFVQLNTGIAYYFNGDKEDALKAIEKSIELAPENFKGRIGEIAKEVEAGTFKL